MQKKLIFGILLLILVVIFTLQNADSVPLKFISWQTEMPVALIIIITLSIGIILGIIFSIPTKKKKGEEKKEEDKDPPLI